jgi:hypothetical protein
METETKDNINIYFRDVGLVCKGKGTREVTLLQAMKAQQGWGRRVRDTALLFL